VSHFNISNQEHSPDNIAYIYREIIYDFFADLMFFREFNRPHATMEVTVTYYWSGIAMVALSVLNRNVVEEHTLRSLANVYV